MLLPFVGIAREFALLVSLLLLSSAIAFAQFETATISGQVSDPSGLSVSGAQVNLVDIDRAIAESATTDRSGLYRFASVHPGRYRMEIRAAGFRVVNLTGLTVNVQDHLEQNFRLTLGSVLESITVEGGAPLVDTETATVSTVLDRNFAENLPMNGRSFQTLVQLAPGVVVTPSTYDASGQFSVNGQRSSSNYWTVDGVSANIGASTYAYTGNNAAGAVPGSSVLGGTNSLVSVDAMQEFRIQTSTYAPEFGRSPGAQVSIVTRSGTNRFHGGTFDYLRNDALDANDWFANKYRSPKPEERQNDFGGTLSGPIFRDRTFFFFSYEGLRLRLPQFQETAVPDLSTRRSAIESVQPILNAFPLPNGPDLGNGQAQFNASYSNSATLNATSIRIDHKLSQNTSLFGRYSYAPSELLLRGAGTPLSVLDPSRITTETVTLGATWSLSTERANDFRANYSRSAGTSRFVADTFGGAIVPSVSQFFPNPFSTNTSQFLFSIFSLPNGSLGIGNSVENVQRQFNFVDSLSWQKASHSFKFGVDYRRLPFYYGPLNYLQEVAFSDVPSAASGNLYFSFISAGQHSTILFQNLGLFGQDTWHVTPRLTLTYGLRWDVDFAPVSTSGPNLVAVVNFGSPGQLGLAPNGTPPFGTKYGNVAPRIGVAYSLSHKSGRETAVRGGFGVFYDLATQEVGNLISQNYPFAATNFQFGGTFPLDSSAIAPPVFSPSQLRSGVLAGFDPNLMLPYTLQWNVSIEQAIGFKQALTASYVGARGRRLIETENILSPNVNVGGAHLVTNAGASDYNALQLQFNRQLSRGLQALASYSWAHSIDTGSSSSGVKPSNLFVPSVGADANRGASDFDIRNTLSTGITYSIPALRTGPVISQVLRDWSIENILQIHSAPPVDVYYSNLSSASLPGQFSGDIRPDLMVGPPIYLFGSQYPGSKVINSTLNQGGPGCIGPFCPPPLDPSTGIPLRQGDLGRNALRGFGAVQWDFAVHRDLWTHESLNLQFRAEMFNLLNHPNFGQPTGDLDNPFFGRSTEMLGRSLDQIPGGGSFNALYQIGGPRSIQVGLKLSF